MGPQDLTPWDTPPGGGGGGGGAQESGRNPEVTGKLNFDGKLVGAVGPWSWDLAHTILCAEPPMLASNPVVLGISLRMLGITLSMLGIIRSMLGATPTMLGTVPASLLPPALRLG